MLRTTVLATTLAFTFASSQAATPLQIKVYQADENSFSVSSTLVYGEKEALVIDGGFTRADGLRIAANVLDSGRTLKTIFVSQADPDYYFGVEAIKSVFPNAEVVATPAVLRKIEASVQGKVGFWGPKMGANAPQHPILPKALAGTTLTLDGEKLEVHGTTGILAHRPYVWIPSMSTVAGNVAVFSNMHVWTADTRSEAEHNAWLAQLDEMEALKPKAVIAGHAKTGGPLDASAIIYTRSYLKTFAHETAKARDAKELIANMQHAYPDAVGAIALDIGAKVAKGEMQWP